MKFRITFFEGASLTLQITRIVLYLRKLVIFSRWTRFGDPVTLLAPTTVSPEPHISIPVIPNVETFWKPVIICARQSNDGYANSLRVFSNVAVVWEFSRGIFAVTPKNSQTFGLTTGNTEREIRALHEPTKSRHVSCVSLTHEIYPLKIYSRRAVRRRP